MLIAGETDMSPESRLEAKIRQVTDDIGVGETLYLGGGFSMQGDFAKARHLLCEFIRPSFSPKVERIYNNRKRFLLSLHAAALVCLL